MTVSLGGTISRYTLLLAESVRATETVARLHGDWFLADKSEETLVAHAIDEATRDRELPEKEFQQLCLIFARMGQSPYLSMVRHDRLIALLGGFEKKVTEDSVVAGVTDPSPTIRHRARPLIAPAVLAPNAAPSELPMSVQRVRHRMREPRRNETIEDNVEC